MGHCSLRPIGLLQKGIAEPGLPVTLFWRAGMILMPNQQVQTAGVRRSKTVLGGAYRPATMANSSAVSSETSPSGSMVASWRCRLSTNRSTSARSPAAAAARIASR